jgi:zinc transporter 1/2/3
MISFKIMSLFLVLLVTLISGAYPFLRHLKSEHGHDFPIGESLAAGVFLGAGLIHMLGDASADFYDLHFDYPLAFLLAGGTFLFFLLLEHIAREIYHQQGSSNAFAILAVFMLSIHSFLAGSALGVANSLSMTVIILLAILAHKWAASFALAVQINKSKFSLGNRLFLFLIFAAMVPLGILCGTAASHSLEQYPLAEPIFASLAAGTFLYLGTLHGLDRAIMIKQCCNLKGFSFVIIGFVIMAVVAIWT